MRSFHVLFLAALALPALAQEPPVAPSAPKKPTGIEIVVQLEPRTRPFQEKDLAGYVMVYF
ncbi:MAG: beta-xylosidase, partial [Pseudomonadota bacterium]